MEHQVASTVPLYATPYWASLPHRGARRAGQSCPPGAAGCEEHWDCLLVSRVLSEEPSSTALMW